MLSTYISIGTMAGLGAVCRFLLDGWINNHKTLDIPYATWIINTLACFLGGMFAKVVLSTSFDPHISLYISTGFLGGFSTFSTAMVEIARLYEDERYLNLFVFESRYFL